MIMTTKRLHFFRSLSYEMIYLHFLILLVVKTLFYVNTGLLMRYYGSVTKGWTGIEKDCLGFVMCFLFITHSLPSFLNR